MGLKGRFQHTVRRDRGCGRPTTHGPTPPHRRSPRNHCARKSHPEVYLPAEKLGRPDAVPGLRRQLNGVLAAKSARMHCIAIPEGAALNCLAFHIADRIAVSLENVDAATLERIGF